jgi:hypothetical protein
MGYINLPQNNFAAMIQQIKTKEDCEVLKDAYYNFVGHRNIVPQVTIDKLMMKALEID